MRVCTNNEMANSFSTPSPCTAGEITKCILHHQVSPTKWQTQGGNTAHLDSTEKHWSYSYSTKSWACLYALELASEGMPVIIYLCTVWCVWWVWSHTTAMLCCHPKAGVRQTWVLKFRWIQLIKYLIYNGKL